jgi:hypothetical protein
MALWLGSTQGLYRCASPFRAEYWTIRDGVAEPPWSIARSGGRVYAGLEKQIVVLGEDRSRWETVARFEDSETISGLLGAEDGTLLVSLSSGGAIQLQANGQILARTEKYHPRGGNMRLGRAAKRRGLDGWRPPGTSGTKGDGLEMGGTSAAHAAGQEYPFGQI